MNGLQVDARLKGNRVIITFTNGEVSEILQVNNVYKPPAEDQERGVVSHLETQSDQGKYQIYCVWPGTRVDLVP